MARGVDFDQPSLLLRSYYVDEIKAFERCFDDYIFPEKSLSEKFKNPTSSSIKIDAEKEFRCETSLSNIERVIHYIKFFHVDF